MSDRPSYEDTIEALDYRGAHRAKTYVDRLIEQWRVTDARMETQSITDDPEVARRVATCLDGSKIWYRQIRHTRTEWQHVETLHIPAPSTEEAQ